MGFELAIPEEQIMRAIYFEPKSKEDKLDVHLSEVSLSRNGRVILGGRFDGAASAVVAIQNHITVLEWLAPAASMWASMKPTSEHLM